MMKLWGLNVNDLRSGFLSFSCFNLLVAGLIAAVAAQTAPSSPPLPKREIEPVVVTVSARALPLSAVSASVTVLTRSAIENSRSESVVDLLRQVPFLHISQTGGRGGLTTVTLRGGKPNLTMVMIDGIPVNDPSNLLGGSFDFSSLSTDNIEQIEIVRGPLSSMYGSEAISGVINIISRRGQGPPSFTAEGLLGNFAARQARGGSQGEIKGFSYSLSASHFANGEQVEKDPFSLTTLAFNSFLPMGKEKLLRFTTRLHKSKAAGFPDHGGGPEFSLLRQAKDADARERVFGVQYLQQLKDWWHYDLELSLFDRDQDSFTPTILDAIRPTRLTQPSIRSHTHVRRLQLNFRNHWKIRDHLTAALTLSDREESGRNNSLIAERFPSRFALDRRTVALGGEVIYSRNRLTADLGLRMDDAQGFKANFSPHVGITYLLFKPGTRLRGNWGGGFKLPSFYALGEPNVGNPKIRPERSRGLDVGIEQAVWGSRGLVSLTYYRTVYRDLVDFSPEQFRLLNRSRALTQGVELAVGAQVSHAVKLNGHVNFLDATIQGTSEPLRDQPRARGGVGVDWRPRPSTNLRLETLWMGPRFDFQLPVPAQTIAGGYSTSNFIFSHQLPHDLTAFVRLDNLFDRKYHEFIGFPNPGRYVRAGLLYRFGL